MQVPTTTPGAPAPLAGPRRRRMVLLTAGALVLAVIGTVAAVASGSSPVPQTRQPSVAATSAVADATPAASQDAASKSSGTSKNSSAPALADGTYPTYVKKVHVKAATLTVDVLQIFQNEEAVQAAIEDGMSRDEAQSQYIYIRNENPLLRTLPVAADVQIHFLGSCEGASDRAALLSELKDVTTPFTTMYYYDITVENGSIREITEHIAGSAC